MQEWAEKDKFNSFNSWKGLLYGDWYKAIAKGKFIPPVEASFDTIHRCNLKCQHCNARRDMTGQRMPDEHLLKLVRFLGNWGVKSICFGGGGEPMLHTGLAAAIRETRRSGMLASIISNGTRLQGDILDALQCCQWVGISVDAGTRETYQKLKGKDLFKDVIDNMVRAVKNSGDCEIAYKFLISSMNQGEIFVACKLARDIGVRDFHARPMDFHHQGMGEELDGKLANVDVDLIRDQMEACHSLEADDFRVFTVTHKFNKDLSPKRVISQCYCAPLVIQICADNKVYFCVDQRHKKEFELGSHYPDPEAILDFWNSEHHRHLTLDAGIPATCTTRCTFGGYAEQCERLFINDDDPMCWKFT